MPGVLKEGQEVARYGVTVDPIIVAAIRAIRDARKTDREFAEYRHKVISQYVGYPEMMSLARTRFLEQPVDTPKFIERLRRPLNGDRLEQWIKEAACRIVPYSPAHMQNYTQGIFSSWLLRRGNEAARLEFHIPPEANEDSSNDERHVERPSGLYLYRFDRNSRATIARLGAYIEDSMRYDPSVGCEVAVKTIRTIDETSRATSPTISVPLRSPEILVIDRFDDREGKQIANIFEYVDMFVTQTIQQ